MTSTVPQPTPPHHSATLRPLSALKGRLTAWYLATLLAILLFVGVGLFLVIRHQISRDLDASLAAATQELVRAARIREMEREQVRGPVVDAIEELHIPERTLYVVDTAGTPVHRTDTPPEWMREVARRAATVGVATAEREMGNDHTLRVRAERFRLTGGRDTAGALVAVAAADDVELEDRYAALIAAFAAATFAAILLVGLGGQLLVRKSTEPIERSIAHMRRFMADAAHELRTPLSVVRARAELALQQPRQVSEYVGALQSIETESQRLGGIVDNLLLLSRADTGELPLTRARLYLDDVALDVARAARPLALQKGVHLSVSQFDEAAIDGDERLIQQLIMILVDNAVKFTPAGGTVDVRVSDPAWAPTLVVEDSGGGIAPEHLPHVFERFFRGDAARGRSDGAGLGLAIARWIAEQHGARIDIASQAGVGTRVMVTFGAATIGNGTHPRAARTPV